MQIPEKRFSFSVIKSLKWLIACGIWLLTMLLIYVLYIARDLPQIDNLEQIKTPQKIIILDNHNQILETRGNIYGQYVPFPKIPRHLINAVLATEDRKFFSHWGIDPIGIMRAAIANLKAGHTVQGGSTITQQLAKIVFLSPTRTFKRKIQEMILAFELEREYTKEQILAIYLNRVYLGSGIFGIDGAAKYYFGKNLAELSLNEAAIIAGLLKAPSRFSPLSNPELTGNRTYQVLLNMQEAGYINKHQVEEAIKEPVKIDASMLGSKKYGYFTNWIYSTLNHYTENEEADLIIQTTLNKKIQDLAQTTLTRYINEFGRTKDFTQGAVIVLDYHGRILAMVGGKNFVSSPFNRAVQSLRPSGSVFKTFVYTAAMEHGYTPTQIVTDKRVVFGSWAPENYYRKFIGDISMEEAFARSLNSVAVQLAYKIGMNNIVALAQSMGIHSPIETHLASSLGTSSVNLLEVASAYGTIANNGFRYDPYGVNYIKEVKENHFLFIHQPQEPLKVLSDTTANYMQTLLESTAIYGSANKAKSNFKIMAKTGTSQDYRDGWCVGFSEQYVVGVWLGNDDYSPMKRVFGGSYPTLIFRDVLRGITPVTSNNQNKKAS